MKRSTLNVFGSLALGVVVLAALSCSDDDGGIKGGNDNVGEFFISAMGESSEYLLQVDDISSGEVVITDNFAELQQSGYTWVFNPDHTRALGLVYNQGDPGLILIYKANEDGSAVALGGNLRITSRFTSYGFFGDIALTSVGGVTPLDENGNAKTYDGTGEERTDGVTFNKITLDSPSLKDYTIETLDVFRDGEQATFSGIVDLGNGRFMTGVVVSQARDESESSGGSSSGTVNYPDECWVAILGSDFNITDILYDEGRIGYSSGRYRSQYYSQIGKTNDGTIYVFSGAYDANTTMKAGAIKVNSSLNGFDANYHFDIESASQGYLFRKVWYISDHYFLLEFYDHVGKITTTLAPASHYAVVDMKNMTFKWVDGLPVQSVYETVIVDGKETQKVVGGIEDSGLPYAHNGKMYFPVTEYGQQPVIYIIDPSTGIATKGLTVRGASNVRAVGRIVAE